MAIADGTDAENPNHASLGAVIIVFGFIMLAIAAIAQFDTTLPEVQHDRPKDPAKRFARLQNRHLEEIAPEFQAGELALSESANSNQNSHSQNPINMMDLNHETGQTVTQPARVVSTRAPGG